MSAHGRFVNPQASPSNQPPKYSDRGNIRAHQDVSEPCKECKWSLETPRSNCEEFSEIEGEDWTEGTKITLYVTPGKLRLRAARVGVTNFELAHYLLM